jgi:hypothetical protein
MNFSDLSYKKTRHALFSKEKIKLIFHRVTHNIIGSSRSQRKWIVKAITWSILLTSH